MRDPVRQLAHDHGDINRRVLELGELIRSGGGDVAAPLRELREQLFFHFAREEEGLFPFVADAVPDRAEQVRVMETAHDTICGSLARMVHLANAGGDRGVIAHLFQRFENAYAEHAAAELALFASLDQTLDGEQRARLAALVDGL
jgi:hypothetical protein